MKRMIFLIIGILFLLNGCNLKEEYQLNLTHGRLLLCNNGSYILIADKSAIVLDVDGLKEVNGYSDGDLIEVWHDTVQTTYPGRTKAYKIELIEDGNMTDVDENVVRQLCDLGWIDYNDMVDRYISAGYIIDSETPVNTVTCKYDYCDMSLDIPYDWMYETKESEKECYIRFRPSDEKEGWVMLQCTTELFGVCGTGLTGEDAVIGGYDATVCRYDNNPIFSFINFTDVESEYIVRNINNDGWFLNYKDEVMSILDSVVLIDIKSIDDTE